MALVKEEDDLWAETRSGKGEDDAPGRSRRRPCRRSGASRSRAVVRVARRSVGRRRAERRSRILPPPPLIRETERTRVSSPTTGGVEGSPREKAWKGPGYPHLVGHQMTGWITPGLGWLVGSQPGEQAGIPGGTPETKRGLKRS